jgi:hypothetical protein
MGAMIDGYEVVQEIMNFRDVLSHFGENGADTENWLFCSTQGWHGTYKTLNDCERIIKGEDETWLPKGAYITVLIIEPKAVRIKWGEIHVKHLDQVEWLRKRVRETLDAISITQEGNV